MKVNNITITLTEDKKFTLEQNDWEGAPDPICMELISEESWQEVADELEKSLNESYSPEVDDSDIEDMFWAEYEKLVLKHCKCFYYEDMTDEEYDVFNNADKSERLAILEKAYARIKAEEKN